jgi:hypothetical protein
VTLPQINFPGLGLLPESAPWWGGGGGGGGDRV